MTNKHSVKPFLILSALISTSLAAHDLPETKCTNIIDNMERLTCYDKLFTKKISPNINNNNDIDTANSKIDSLKLQRTEPEPQQNKSLFGLEKEVAKQTPEEITSKAIGTFKSWTKKMKIELENGQVWEVTSSGRLYHPTSNPTVTISKGALGSFYLGIEGVNRRLKVKRIK